ncbi:hypothetical protein SC09_contig4orf00812 [Bacillus subtilis]|uniref:Uncharacterized protein n=1 Tax=Bacillus subtilis TaxID=1423 RepID=A0A0D1IAB1_BACIU|nr:hypothetical protein SC09_contig4orf00812 [Bacillus subtilis]
MRLPFHLLTSSMFHTTMLKMVYPYHFIKQLKHQEYKA